MPVFHSFISTMSQNTCVRAPAPTAREHITCELVYETVPSGFCYYGSYYVYNLMEQGHPDVTYFQINKTCTIE